MNEDKSEERTARRINVGLWIDEDELAEMRALTRVDANSQAVMAMARLGVEQMRKAREA